LIIYLLRDYFFTVFLKSYLILEGKMQLKVTLIAILFGLSASIFPVNASLDKPTAVERLYSQIESYCQSNKEIGEVRVYAYLDITNPRSNIGSVHVFCKNSNGNLYASIKYGDRIELFKNNKLQRIDTSLKDAGTNIVDLVRDCANSKQIESNSVNHLHRDENTGKIHIRYGTIIQ
jgi:hypothetical protein